MGLYVVCVVLFHEVVLRVVIVLGLCLYFIGVVVWFLFCC